jgi:glycosyltransferase involved in cell wall biosynthesis
MVASNAMPAAPPLISVIIVCKNPGRRLVAAVESVWAQPLALAELIVVDGMSTDDTRAWLETHRGQIATVISEPDSGIYEAMNKGLATARGEWIFFLGSDDQLASSTILADVASTLRQTAASIVVGEAAYSDGRVYRYPGKAAAIRRNFLHHQAAFYRRSLFLRHGIFDTRLRIQADYDYNLRLLLADETFSSLSLRISACSSGGLSDSGCWKNYREEIAVRHRHFSFLACCPWDAVSAARYLRKRALRHN